MQGSDPRGPDVRLIARRAAAAPALLAALLALAILVQTRSTRERQRWVEHTHEVTTEVTRVQKLLVDQESAVLGYLLTGDRALLAPFDDGDKKLPGAVAHLGTLVSDNPAQIARARDLEHRQQMWRASAAASLRDAMIAPPWNSAMSTTLIETTRGRHVNMAAIRNLVDEMLREEESLLTERQAAAAGSAALLLFGGVGLALLFGLGVAFSVRRSIRHVESTYDSALRAAESSAESEAEARAAADEARRSAEEQRAILDLIIEQSGEGIIMSDHMGVLRVFNPAAERQHGASRQEVAAPAWAETYGLFTLDGRPLPLTETPLFRAVQGTISIDARWLVKRPDGRMRTLVGTATPLRRPDGSSAGGVLVTRDETDRLQAEREREELVKALAKSNAELDQFAYVASHDLKAPLRGIANLSQWVEEDLGEALSGESRENMHLLRGRVHRMEALIDGILDYSRAGRVRQAPEEVDTAVLVREIVDLLSPPPSTSIEMGPQMPVVTTERVPLQQVLMNLIGNAVKYTIRPDARVYVSSTDAGDFYELRVSDNGPGIDSAYHDRIWGIFQTLEARDDVEGTGIGLAIVKKIVETRGGRAWVESKTAQGSTFVFTWPKRPSTEEIAA